MNDTQRTELQIVSEAFAQLAALIQALNENRVYEPDYHLLGQATTIATRVIEESDR